MLKKKDTCILSISIFFLFAGTQLCLAINELKGWLPSETKLVVTNKLDTDEKELVIETSEWKVVMSLFYNGGIYKMYDKVHDPNQQDNLVTDNSYSQGGLFDYDVYLQGDQEHMTTLGRNDSPGQATLEILENNVPG